jgi:predicted dehydrogenase
MKDNGVTQDTIRYGVIGCGMMGQEHLRNIALLPGAEVAAIFEPNAAMAQAAQAIAPGAVLCGSVARLLAEERLDCLLVASPNHVHVDQILEIARTRPLPLLIEKPLYTDAAQESALLRLADGYPALIWVAMEYRYMPPIMAFLEECETATGGLKMLSIREHRFPFLNKVGDWNRFNRNTGGTLVEKCCHFFDLMRLALKSDPVRVTASAGQAVNHRDELIDGAAPDVWDSAYVIVDFASGARAMLDLCMFAEGAEYQEEITAVGELGKIAALVPGPGRFWPQGLGPAPTPKLVLSPRAPKCPETREVPVPATLLDVGDHNGATYFQHQRFVDVVRGVAAPEVGFEDGRRAVLMGLAAQQSATEGRAVTFSLPQGARLMAV